ncbi:MAG: XdhC family protein [Acutalibacteraceae bacterium]
MKALFTSMLQALAQGEGVVLCSILASSGSTPRGAGAKWPSSPTAIRRAPSAAARSSWNPGSWRWRS